MHGWVLHNFHNGCVSNITSSHCRKAGCNTRRNLSMSAPTLSYLRPYFQRDWSSGAKGSLNHQRVLYLFVLWSDLLHLLPSLPCHLHQARLGALWENVLVNTSVASTRMCLVFPSQSISVLTDIPLPVRGIKLCDGNKQTKRQEMSLIFRLWTCQPRGLNSDIQFIWSSRARAQRNFRAFKNEASNPKKKRNHFSTEKR